MIPLSVPCIRGNEWRYVKDCLDTEWVSSAGAYVERFESEFRAFTGAAHAVACVNGTAALQVALRIVGVQPGDEVIVPTVTFIATVNAVTYSGGEPVFMDCDEYYNIDPAKTAEFVETQTDYVQGSTYDRMTGRRIAAIVPVHVFGNAAGLQDLVGMCAERNVKVVEDAAESLGTFYSAPDFDGRHTGTVGDIGCFSFNGNKVITTGGGGMIVTDVPEYAERAAYLTTQSKDDEERFIHNEVGYNYRLTNVQAAIGVAQLEVLPDFLAAKRRRYLEYREAIGQIDGLSIADTPPYAENNNWMYPLQIELDVYQHDREGLMDHLKGHGIQTRPLWYPNHLQVPYRRCRHYRIERAYRMLDVTLNIPCSVNLTDGDMRFVIDKLRDG